MTQVWNELNETTQFCKRKKKKEKEMPYTCMKKSLPFILDRTGG